MMEILEKYLAGAAFMTEEELEAVLQQVFGLKAATWRLYYFIRRKSETLIIRGSFIADSRKSLKTR